MSRFAKYTWITLVTNFGVILWGAFVRATGSGAGCGEHWPTCNGEVIPRPEDIETMIEFTHRLTSGVALIRPALVVWAVRLFERGHRGGRRRGRRWASCGGGGPRRRTGAVRLGRGRRLRGARPRVHALAQHPLLAGSDGAHRLGGPTRQAFDDGPVRAIALGFAGLFGGVSGATAALGDTLFPGLADRRLLCRPRSELPLDPAAATTLFSSLSAWAYSAWLRLRPDPRPRLATALMVLLGLRWPSDSSTRAPGPGTAATDSSPDGRHRLGGLRAAERHDTERAAVPCCQIEMTWPNSSTKCRAWT